MPNLIEIKNHKKSFEVTMKADNTAEILLYGAIGESFWDDSSVGAPTFKKTLDALPASTKTIHLRVNSPGGSVFDGMTMYELIKAERNKGRKVVAYIDGLAASIASVIVLAADEIIVGDGSMYMIHKPLVGVYGNATELERYITILDKIESQMVTIYSKKTGISKAEIEKLLAEETWFTSEEALEKGFVDSQFENCETLHIAASLLERSTHLGKGKPVMNVKQVNTEAKNKLDSFLASAKEFAEKRNIK